MITLTIPRSVNSVLGGSASVDYDKLVLSPFTMTPHPTQRRIEGRVKMQSTTNPEMPDILGSFLIDLATGIVEVSVPQLDFYQKKTLSAAQITAVQGWINNAQNAIEAGFISVGIVAGVQSTGA